MLHHTALLVTLRLSAFAPRRKDKRVTADVLRQHHAASSDLGAWSTTLLPAHATDPVSAIASKIRKYHAEQTLCWDRDGTNLLPTVRYMDYTAEMNTLRDEWQEKVNHFVQHYPDYLEEARRTLNGLFNPRLYPHIGQVRNKFSFRLEAEPVPAAADFRIQLRQDERASLERQLEERLAAAAAAAQRDLLSRLAEPLTGIVNTLAAPDKPVHPNQLAALARVLGDVDALNVTNHPGITALKADIQSAMQRYTPQQMNQDSTLRAAATERAQAVLDKIAGWA